MSIDEIFSLRGKTAVVIGGGGALGGAMASGFAEAGANVAVAGRDRGRAETVAAAIRERGHCSIALQTDVTKREGIQSLLESILLEFGQVDILLNSAGINSDTPFFQIDDFEWERILDVNLRGVFMACQIFGKYMVERGRGGSIINISSASSDPPLSKVFTYSVSKGGVNQITKSLAREFAPHGVRVNAILPGFFPAEQNRHILSPERVTAILSHTPMGRFGEPSELVGGAIYLASERASSFVTGAILRIDGGFGAMTI